MQLEINDILKLEEKFGSPLYVFDKKDFVDNFNEFSSCFKSYYSKYTVSYSYKTNYTPYICKIVKDLGGYAEVVSDMEYNLARNIGYPADKIIFNGPDKDQYGLEAILEGSIVNVDNIDELRRIIKSAQENSDKVFNIGFRVNMSIGQNFISRFGLDENDLEKAFLMVSELDNVKVKGLQCHISRCRDRESWKKRTVKMLSYADRYFNVAPEYLDFGSGMYGKMEPFFADQFSDIPEYKEYAEVTAKLVAEHYNHLDEDKKPILFTEPGTTLVNKYMYVISKVNAIKTINGRYFAVLNCSEHILGETCTLKQLPIDIVHSGSVSEFYKDIDFTGYTCLEQDVVFKNYSGELAVGDRVVFGNTGGYSNVLKPPFIRPNCAMVATESDGGYELIKRAESYDDIFNTYIF